MKNSLADLIARITPYLIAGISLAIFITLVVLLSYVLLWGLLIGAVLFGVAYLKNKFFPSKKTPPAKSKKKGRVIEHDDID